MTYNDPKSGGFEYHPYAGQETGPGLVFVQGGAFKMGQTTDDVMYDWDNKRRTVTVSSFYMDETEVSNAHYREYLHWLARVHGDERIEIVNRAKPDTAAWRRKLGYNENYVKYYFRHPAYQDYPVVGVSWLQATDYCKWRTDRVNEYILIREGVLEQKPASASIQYFTTDAYYQYPGNLDGNFVNLVPDLSVAPEEGQGRRFGNRSDDAAANTRHVRIEDGLLLPEYRLPTEAEWEYAALGLIGATEAGKDFQNSGRIYPWDGTSTRESELRRASFLRNGENVSMSRGDFKANFMRGSGDMMGIAAGPLNDGADITAPVTAFMPNDYGLYNMAGNVSEWVMDVYRPLNSMDMEAFRSFRGNQFQTLETDAAGAPLVQYEYTEYDLKLLRKELESFKKAYLDSSKTTATASEKEFFARVMASVGQTETLCKEKRFDDAWSGLEEFVEEMRDAAEDETNTIIPIVLNYFSRNVTGVPGQVRFRDVRVEENLTRDNYKESNYIGYLDGDSLSGTYQGEFTNPTLVIYNKESTLISDRTRVYKGGGWDDRMHYLSPGTRRYLDESKSSASIGFRCAMDRLGPPLELTDY